MGSSCGKAQTAAKEEAHGEQENFQKEGEQVVNNGNVEVESQCQQPEKDAGEKCVEEDKVQKEEDKFEKDSQDKSDDMKKQADANGDELEKKALEEEAEAS
ncbi:hypothetical protein, unknown function [Leishmania braziliensis MHOM/BR/75/M2904]|uniref:Uncharacterized protein n=2 Tax=Leishmania braziliensis TaxID=5660 RepID=A4HCX1_LEIBR|nr:hypothetical protein, unknown function [Leishmania braziliensis MHOM/BR/75/M2904]CAJ2473252.1 unnamed protein product [Leishmania braziliensis]CAJ2473790.1 unnamed protein product [Leishmania braziliensis]CAM36617.1 hypothetical protein, unknown function [Leishmania braziliensis MHOM/BR/75/M2904]SYZ66090.1 hypothetical_protein [Leishmania braziliensis MHOM/BR/75/M2904]